MNFEKEIRRQNRLERLGTNDPRCGICGETNEFCLEAHHIAGRKYDDSTVILCRNCHRLASDDQKDHPDRSKEGPSLSEQLVHFLLGVADLLALLAEQCRKFASKILDSLTSARPEVRQ